MSETSSGLPSPSPERTPPCVVACPVRNDWPVVLELVRQGSYAAAACQLLEGNPFPAVLGRVCPQACQSACNRQSLGGAVQLPSLERFLGDYALDHDHLLDSPPASLGPVAVVGGGPTGLSTAWFMRRLGYAVTVFEKEDRPGGTLWTQVPPYRLPRHVLDRELERFPRTGIQVRTRQALGRDFTLADLRAQYRVVFVSSRLTAPRTLDVPGEDHPDVLDGTAFLRRLHGGEPVGTGERVAVIGGGTTAVDCARTLVRQGKRVVVLFRSTRKEMSAPPREVAEALEEGVRFEFLVRPTEILAGDGMLGGIRCLRTVLAGRDEWGRPRPIPKPGTDFTIPVDTIIRAPGEAPDPGIAASKEGGGFVIHLPDADLAGDPEALAGAIRSAREAAFTAHRRLTDRPHPEPDLLKRRGVLDEVAAYQTLDLSDVEVVPPEPIEIRPAEERVQDFEEVRGGLDPEAAHREAWRCLRCGLRAATR